jgi:hypothetical protein
LYFTSELGLVPTKIEQLEEDIKTAYLKLTEIVEEKVIEVIK